MLINEHDDNDNIVCSFFSINRNQKHSAEGNIDCVHYIQAYMYISSASLHSSSEFFYYSDQW